MKTEIIKCLECSRLKEVDSREVRRGNGKFCSRSCSSRYNGRVQKLNNVVCSGCGKEFYKSKSSKKNSKSGLFFCDRACKDSAQRLGGIEEIQPPHYNNGKHNYREIAYRTYERKCNKCGYNNHPEILEVHHKDKDTNNNNVANLEVLCPNCHKLAHLEKFKKDYTRINKMEKWNLNPYSPQKHTKLGFIGEIPGSTWRIRYKSTLN